MKFKTIKKRVYLIHFYIADQIRKVPIKTSAFGEFFLTSEQKN